MKRHGFFTLLIVFGLAHLALAQNPFFDRSPEEEAARTAASSQERIAREDRASRERQSYVFGGAIVIAGVAIGAGLYLRGRQTARAADRGM